MNHAEHMEKDLQNHLYGEEIWQKKKGETIIDK